MTSIGLEDLPIALLRKLDLGRPILNHRDEDKRPACAGQHELGHTFDRAPLPNNQTRAPRTAAVPPKVELSAFRFCAPCPVRQECKDWADSKREEGLWGGVYRVKVGGGRSYQTHDLLASLDLDEAVPA